MKQQALCMIERLVVAMARDAPGTLAREVPTLVARLQDVAADVRAEVREAALAAMKAVGASIQNYEIGQLAPDLVASLVDAANDKQTDKCLDALLATSFVHVVDAAALALVTPILIRALRQPRGPDVKRKAANIVASMAVLVKDPRDILVYLDTLFPLLKLGVVESTVEVSSAGAKALAALHRSLPEECMAELEPWYNRTLRSNQLAERQGAAVGLSYFVVDREHFLLAFLPKLLADVGTAASAVDDGPLRLLDELPTRLGLSLAKYVRVICEALLEKLDAHESISDLAYKAP